MLERHLATIAENVDIRRRLAINAERMDLLARSTDWHTKIEKIGLAYSIAHAH